MPDAARVQLRLPRQAHHGPGMFPRAAPSRTAGTPAAVAVQRRTKAAVYSRLESQGTSVWQHAQTTRNVYACVQVSPHNGDAVAQKIQTVFIDDLDGSDADETVRFGLDGTEYEIDLNAGHTQALRDALAPYIRAARRVSGAARRPARSARRASGDGLSAIEVREWAKTQGIEGKDRGRVPADLAARFSRQQLRSSSLSSRSRQATASYSSAC
jgi:Lsr2